MAINRQSQELGLNVPQTQLAPGQVARTRLRDVDIQDTSRESDTVLSGLLKVGGELAGQAFDANVQEEVLRGARERMAGTAEDAVETNPLSAPFVKAGYRKQDFRIRQAQFTLEMGQFIAGKGKEMSPEQFRSVMAAKARGVLDGAEGLNSNDQVIALAGQTKAEEGLFAAHAKAYSDWSIEQGAKAFRAQGNSIINDIGRTVDSDELAYNAASERAGLYFLDIMQNEALPAETREDVAREFLLGALSVNGRKAVEDLRDAGALDIMSLANRREIQGAMDRSKAATRSQDAMHTLEQDTTLELAGESGAIGIEAVDAHARSMVERQIWTDDQARAYRIKAMKGLANGQAMDDLIQATMAGDITRISALGFTPEEAVAQFDKSLASRSVPLSERLQQTTRVGIQMGVIPKTVGSAVAQGVRAITSAKEGAPLQPELVNTMNDLFSTVLTSQQANPAAGNVLLQAIPEQERGAVAYTLRQMQQGIEPAQALREFAANDQIAQQLDEFDSFKNSKGFKDRLAAGVEDKFLSGFLGRTGNLITGNANLSDNEGVLSTVRREVSNEAQWLAGDRRNAGLLTSPEGHDALVELAAANVKARTIEVGGPGWILDRERSSLILPRGQTAQDIFGTADTTTIGRVLAEKFKPRVEGLLGDRSTVGFVYSPQNGAAMVEYDENGQRLDEIRFDPKAIGAEVNKRNAETINALQGANYGADIKVGTGTVTMDGGNASSMRRPEVFNWRKELAAEEGYTETPFKDGSGTTVGVGHQLQPGDEGKRVTRWQIERWFADDTDAALSVGRAVAQQLGVRNQQAVLGLASAAFQLGAGGLAEFKDTQRAIARKDWAAFVEAVDKSKWAQQTPRRTALFKKRMKFHFDSPDDGPNWYDAVE